MDARKIIKELLHDRHMSQKDFVEISEYKSQSNVTGILNRSRSMRVDSLFKFLTPLGCELIIRDPKTGKEYQVTVEDEKKG